MSILNGGLFGDVINREQTIARAQQIMRRFGNLMQGNDLNYESLKQQIGQVLPLLARINDDDSELLEKGLSSIHMFPEVQEAFRQLRLLQAADPSVLGREQQLKESILRTFVRCFDQFENSELDPLYNQLSPEVQSINPERPEPNEATADERLLREFISSVAFSCQSATLFTQCQRAQAVVDALCSRDQAAIRQAGGDYTSAIAGLGVQLVLEPILTTMAGRSFNASTKGDLPRGQQL